MGIGQIAYKKRIYHAISLMYTHYQSHSEFASALLILDVRILLISNIKHNKIINHQSHFEQA